MYGFVILIISGGVYAMYRQQGWTIKEMVLLSIVTLVGVIGMSLYFTPWKVTITKKESKLVSVDPGKMSYTTIVYILTKGLRYE